MSLIGKAICLFRERAGRKPVHAFVRRMIPLGAGPVRVCSRCGLTVPVKTRKRKQEVVK